jgi:hypothetical protein
MNKEKQKIKTKEKGKTASGPKPSPLAQLRSTSVRPISKDLAPTSGVHGAGSPACQPSFLLPPVASMWTPLGSLKIAARGTHLPPPEHPRGLVAAA